MGAGRSQDVASVTVRFWAASFATWLSLCAGTAWARDNDSAIYDCRMTARARQIIQQDPSLANIPGLGITVRNGVATVWGEVPTVELARRAADRVRQVQGILDVKNELIVPAPGAWKNEFLKSPVPRRTSGANAEVRSPSILTSRWADWESEAANSSSSSAAGAGITLMPPIVIAAPRALTIPQPPADLLTAVEQLRQTDARYSGLRAEIQGGVVRLRGMVARWEDVFELANRISRIDGVERVILQEVRTPTERRAN